MSKRTKNNSDKILKNTFMIAAMGVVVSAMAYIGSGLIESNYSISIGLYKIILLLSAAVALISFIMSVISVFKSSGWCKTVSVVFAVICICLIAFELFGAAFLGVF